MAALTGRALRSVLSARNTLGQNGRQDVVGLEQEYADKSAQFSAESRASKTLKVDLEQCAGSKQCCTPTRQ